MNGVAFHFAGGDAFFSGCALLLLGCLLAATSRWRRAARLSGGLGILFVTLSAIPLPYPLYGVWGFMAVMWLLFDGRRVNEPVAADGSGGNHENAGDCGEPSTTPFRLRRAVIVLTLLALGWELTFRFGQPALGRRFPRMDVIADSVSAGMRGPTENTWPKQFPELFHVTVGDHSREGATAESAQKQALEISPGPALVLVEIGGNDVLGRTTAAEFNVALDRLLAGLQSPDRELVMLELPLPPFYNKFGMIQRNLARRHGVRLIPRRAFAKLLFTPGATLDGIHLSDRGHTLMAEWIWSEVGTSLTAH